MNLWRHEVRRTKLRLQKAITVLVDVRSEAKVRNLKVVILVKQHVLSLEVTMHNTLSVAEVETRNELLEVVACEVVGKRTSHCQDVEQFAVLGQLEHDVLDLLGSAVGLRVCALAIMLKVQHIIM